MNKLIEDLIKKGMGNFMDRSRDALAQTDEVYLNDCRSEDELGQLYENLALTKEQKAIINDYVACTSTVNHRYADISYMCGIKDTVAPEGTGYRARTRFAKFFNLPELMNIFKEVADIKTADQLDLPTPEVEYHNIVSEPTEFQQSMVKELSKRAEKVHGGIDPHIDNMLRITSDGRKLGLDQRIINPALPDEPETKVNKCVANILKIWKEGDTEKLTQLVFCDIATPSGKPTDDSENAPFTNIYDDIRRKLIAGGMAPEQVAFIHNAT